MNAISHLRASVKHPFRWMSGALFGILALSFMAVALRLHEAGWTCSPDYQVFYAPHSPPSRAVVRRIREMQDKKLLSADFKLSKPTLIAPVLFGAGGSTDPTIIIGFDADIARSLSKSHAAKNAIR